jgi:ABC-type antimicrobial peptide transport system permease subunit
LETLTHLEDTWKRNDTASGATNKLRLQTGMASFFLLCVFLGISGTFWLRGQARRGEIGLRKALGGSRRRILTEFLIESWGLTTLSWLVGIIIVYNRVHVTGFAEEPEFLNDMYIQNRFAPHFWLVSGIVYALMLLIAFIGTWMPARQAAKTEPSDALRDDN